MTAALLCPGPSLARWPAETFARHDLRIGVNRAAAYIACDWWAASDLPCVRDWCGSVIGHPSLYSREQVFERHPRWTGIAFESLMKFYPTGFAWHLYTAVAALVLAKHLGAHAVEVFGADWTDAADWDGVAVVGQDRRPARWKREGELWQKTCEWLRPMQIRRMSNEQHV